MSRFHTRRALAALLVSTLSLGIAVVPGCMTPQAAINRVQPNALEKAVFEGEWYYQQTVIDSPYSAGFTFVGEQGQMERIRWEIQEDYLIARRSYQWIANSEPEGIGGPSDETGAPIAMYRIESHFDIRREYNPVTGEELNVISENSTDRPWYARQFMRVDWSTNLIPETDVFTFARIIDGVEAEPVAYYVQDQNDPNRPRFETGASGEVEYMDIVNQMFVRPGAVDIEGFGRVPVCFLYYQDHLDCAAAQITVRNSFLRVDDHDYQPMVYSGDRMERFGYFNTVRAGYDEEYGVVEPVRFHFVNRHNLWQQSHRMLADGSYQRCTTDDGCDGHGSVCDLDWARAHRALDDAGHLSGACTIPYRERTAQPVVYYLSSTFPPDLMPEAQHFGDDWSSAFVDTVASMRENECLADGGDTATCATERTREDAQRMFVLCPSPVPAGADPLCGPEGTEARPGDLRYSLIGYVNEPHLSSPLGYGPSSADPLTGEIVMGNAFVYGAAMETLESLARDMVRLLNGDVTFEDIENGQVVQDWVDTMTASSSETTSAPGALPHVVPVDPAHMDEITRGMDFSYARDLRPDSARELPRSFGEAEEARQASYHRLFEAGAFGTHAADAVASRLYDTDIEHDLASTDMRMAADIDPSLPLDATSLEASSILRGLSPARMTAFRQFRDRLQTHGCILDSSFADDGLLGLAREIHRAATTGDGSMEWYGVPYQLRNASGGIDYELVRTMLRHPIFEAVTAHEIGHTLGLRHNFSGSFDALNYLPTYWDLRNDGMMAPRLWDPESAAETDGRIREYQYSTVMDYGVNFVVTDSHGIGHYDRAAIKMGYGDLVEVFANAAQHDVASFWAAINQYGWTVPVTVDSFGGMGVSAQEYTDWPEVIAGTGMGVAALQDRVDVPYASLGTNSDAFLAAQGIDLPLLDHAGRVAVPYMFCSDEQADLNPDCLRYDQGADPYESISTIADTYWNYYIFTNFRRQRIGYSPASVITRVHDRYFEKLQNANDIYALDRSFFEDVFGGSLTPDFWTGRHGMGAWTAATAVSYGLLTRVVSAPTPDTYTRRLTADGIEVYTAGGSATAPGAHDINAFDGRYLDTTWNFDAGYYWFDQIQRVGYFYDKVIALAVLTDPTTHFIGRDTDTDIRRFQINFASTFGPATTSFFRGVMGQDWHAVGPRFDGRGELVYPSPGQQADGSMAGTPIDPNVGFSVQLFGSVLGMTYLPQTYNQDFLNRSRIWVRGGAEEVTIDPSMTTVEFTDESSGLTYVAVSYPDAMSGDETGVGAQMLVHADRLRTRGSDAELRRYIDNIDVVRRLTFLLGGGAQP